MLLFPISLRWMPVLPGGLCSGQSAHGFWLYQPSPLMWTRHERLVCVVRVACMPRAIQLLLQAVWELMTYAEPCSTCVPGLLAAVGAKHQL